MRMTKGGVDWKTPWCERPSLYKVVTNGGIPLLWGEVGLYIEEDKKGDLRGHITIPLCNALRQLAMHGSRGLFGVWSMLCPIACIYKNQIFSFLGDNLEIMTIEIWTIRTVNNTFYYYLTIFISHWRCRDWNLPNCFYLLTPTEKMIFPKR
jgi:hypothetical protein